jgi:hypothetical protein
MNLHEWRSKPRLGAVGPSHLEQGTMRVTFNSISCAHIRWIRYVVESCSPRSSGAPRPSSRPWWPLPVPLTTPEGRFPTVIQMLKDLPFYSVLGNCSPRKRWIQVWCIIWVSRITWILCARRITRLRIVRFSLIVKQSAVHQKDSRSWDWGYELSFLGRHTIDQNCYEIVRATGSFSC